MSVPIEPLLKLFSSLRKGYKILTKYYHVVWKKPHKIESDILLKTRRYRSYYYPRPTDSRILENLEQKQNTLIVGESLMGKTRAAFEALEKVKTPYVVTIAKNVHINRLEEDFIFPPNLSFRRNKLVIIDNLHDFVDNENFQILIERVYKKHCVLLATCRSGKEFSNAEEKFAEKDYRFSILFGPNIVELKKIDDQKGKEIAEKLDIPWKNVMKSFNHTPGSILLELDVMKKRYEKCSFEQKTILRSLKKMGNYLSRKLDLRNSQLPWGETTGPV